MRTAIRLTAKEIEVLDIVLNSQRGWTRASRISWNNRHYNKLISAVDKLESMVDFAEDD